MMTDLIHSPYVHSISLSLCVKIRILLFQLSVCWIENSTSLVLAPALSCSSSLCISLFVFLYWHSIVFMWVLAAAVVTRRLPPKRFGGKKNLFLSETNNRVTQWHVTNSTRNPGTFTVFWKRSWSPLRVFWPVCWCYQSQKYMGLNMLFL